MRGGKGTGDLAGVWETKSMVERPTARRMNDAAGRFGKVSVYSASGVMGETHGSRLVVRKESPGTELSRLTARITSLSGQHL